jgi:hypothetical protein
MKRNIVVITLAISGVMFAASSIRAEIANSPPNDVDVSQWNKWEARSCFANGTEDVVQQFSYKNGPLERMINRYIAWDKSIYERHFVSFSGENGFLFELFYMKKGNTWTRYESMEDEKVTTLLREVTQRSNMIPCEK